MPHLDPPTLLFHAPPAGTIETGPLAAPTNPPSARALEAPLFQQRLNTVLRGTVEGLKVEGAEMMLLDDTTAELRSSADYGDHASRKPQSLRDAQADVAALSGGAVVLEDAEMLAEWNVTRPCRSAVCVPVSSDTTIHGTLWLYDRREREYQDHELQLIEIVAGRLAVEIERRRLLEGC